MAKDQYVERLRAVPLFESLSKRELALLLRQADNIRFPPHHHVVWEGAAGEEFWMVVDGELAVERDGKKVAKLVPGDYFGELAVIDSAPRSASVISTTPVELLVITRRRFWATLDESPTLMRKFIVGLARRLREAEVAKARGAADVSASSNARTR